jgi:hypothetical protein
MIPSLRIDVSKWLFNLTMSSEWQQGQHAGVRVSELFAIGKVGSMNVMRFG